MKINIMSAKEVREIMKKSESLYKNEHKKKFIKFINEKIKTHASFMENGVCIDLRSYYEVLKDEKFTIDIKEKLIKNGFTIEEGYMEGDTEKRIVCWLIKW